LLFQLSSVPFDYRPPEILCKKPIANVLVLMNSLGRRDRRAEGTETERKGKGGGVKKRKEGKRGGRKNLLCLARSSRFPTKMLSVSSSQVLFSSGFFVLRWVFRRAVFSL